MLARLLPLALLTATPALAQLPPPRDLAAQASAMRAIGWMQGEWLGQGWRDIASGERVRSSQSIKVSQHGSGLLFTIEGVSLRQPEAATEPSKQSFAVISYDERTKQYPFRSFGFGEMIEAVGEVPRSGVFRWTVPAGPALLRFTVDGSKPGTWNEMGERSLDKGTKWTTLYMLTAHRIRDR